MQMGKTSLATHLKLKVFVPGEILTWTSFLGGEGGGWGVWRRVVSGPWPVSGICMTPTKTHRPQDPLVATNTHRQPPGGSQATLEATREDMPPGATTGARPPGGTCTHMICRSSSTNRSCFWWVNDEAVLYGRKRWYVHWENINVISQTNFRSTGEEWLLLGLANWNWKSIYGF